MLSGTAFECFLFDCVCLNVIYFRKANLNTVDNQSYLISKSNCFLSNDNLECLLLFIILLNFTHCLRVLDSIMFFNYLFEIDALHWINNCQLCIERLTSCSRYMLYI